MLAVGTLLAASGIALFFAYPNRLSSDPTFMSPHENVRYHLARQWLRTGRPTYRVPELARLPGEVVPAVTPRDAALLGDQVVPKDFPYALGTVAALLALDPRLPLLLTTISGVAVLLLAGLLAWELSRSLAVAVLAAALVAASTSFFAATFGLLETGATTAAAVLAGTLALSCARRRPLPPALSVHLDLLGGACLGVAVGLHHGVALLAAGLLTAFALPRSGDRPRRWLTIGVGMVAGLLPMLAYDTWLFGSPFTTGYGIGGRFFDRYFEHHTAGLFDLRPALLGRELRLYWLRPEVLLPVVAAAVAGGREWARWIGRPVGLGLLLGGPTYVAFMGARPLWGMDRFQIDASMLRYSLPVLALVAVLAASVPASLRPGPWRTLAWAVVCIPLALGLTSTFLARPNPLQLRADAATADRTRHALLATTPPGAFVLTARADKYLWPDRWTVTVAYLVRERQGGPDPVYAVVPGPAQVADVLARLVKAGKPTYLLDDGWLDRIDPPLDRSTQQLGIWRHDTSIGGLWRYTARPTS